MSNVYQKTNDLKQEAYWYSRGKGKRGCPALNWETYTQYKGRETF